MPRIRLTVRRLMVLVLLVAILMAAGIEARRLLLRSREYRGHLAYHTRREREERRNLGVAESIRRKGKTLNREMSLVEEVARLRIPYHARLRRKYERAVTQPWEPLPPDPPEPGDELVWKILEIPPVTDDIPLIDVSSMNFP